MLSVLIPTYNCPVYGLACEVSRQCTVAGIHFEIIVLDDCSGPDLRYDNEKINAIPHCRYVVSEENAGRTLTRKKLAETAGYGTLLFLDADVMPASGDFIEKYVPHIGGLFPVVFGGYAYRPEHLGNDRSLRLKYGQQREEKPASHRNKAPYTTIFSGNLLVEKEVFLSSNYAGNHSYYGMDSFFSYNLYLHKVPVLHIDNPIYHLGIEKNEVFFKKALESVKVRKQMLEKAPGAENTNSLLKYYKILKKYRLTGTAALFFRIGKPMLKKLIFSKNPSLFCLDLYRLGYMCSL